MQQSDTLRPTLFYLLVQPLIRSILPELNVWYLGDITIAGEALTVIDLQRVISRAGARGVELNFAQCKGCAFVGSAVAQEDVRDHLRLPVP